MLEPTIRTVRKFTVIYWLMTVLAAVLLALTGVLLVSIASRQEMPDWRLDAVSLALLAVCVWFVGRVLRYFVRRLRARNER